MNLQHNNIQDKDIQILVKHCLEYRTPIKELLIHNNLINIEGSKSIAELIKDINIGFFNLINIKKII